MARLKRVREESVRDLGMLLMIDDNETYEEKEIKLRMRILLRAKFGVCLYRGGLKLINEK